MTHTAAFSLPVILGVAGVLYLKPMVARLNALLVESYSRQVAGFDVAAGDARAGRAGLKRHLDRVTALRRQLFADGDRDGGPAQDDCIVLAEMTYLSPADEREAVARDAAEACRKTCRTGTCDADRVLAIGARWVKLERGVE